jgi:hypothetical protein
VLVHVERQDGDATSHRVRVVRGPLVNEGSFARLEYQQHPTGASGQGFAHRDELLTPSFNAPEIRLQREDRRRCQWLAGGAEAVEVQLVQHHRVGGDEFLALEPIQVEAGWRSRKASPATGRGWRSAA